jgi:hypothetical protein
MRERGAEIVLLVRAFEEVDREGCVLSPEQRATATRRALMVTNLGSARPFRGRRIDLRAETVERRARLLYNSLCRKIPSVPRVLELARLHSLLAPTVVGVALLMGLLVAELDAAGHVNILSPPLLVLLGWNLLVVAVMLALLLARLLVRGLREQKSRRHDFLHPRRRVVAGVADGVVRFALWRSRLGWRKTGEETPGEQHVISRGFIRFCGLWHRLTGRLLQARVRRMLHLAALALVAGAIVGMWIRGVGLDYPATWQSTMLEARQVQKLLDLLLGPAATLLRQPVPDVTWLESPHGQGPAAIWVELYALTAVIFVGVPRLGLALFEYLRASRLAARVWLDFDDSYFSRLLPPLTVNTPPDRAGDGAAAGGRPGA